jgi:hypothetical protein
MCRRSSVGFLLHAGACLREGPRLLPSLPGLHLVPFVDSIESDVRRCGKAKFRELLSPERVDDGWMAHEGRSGAVHPVGLIRFGLDVGAPNVLVQECPRLSTSAFFQRSEFQRNVTATTLARRPKIGEGVMDVFASSTVPCHVSQYGVSTITPSSPPFRLPHQFRNHPVLACFAEY